MKLTVTLFVCSGVIDIDIGVSVTEVNDKIQKDILTVDVTRFKVSDNHSTS